MSQGGITSDKTTPATDIETITPNFGGAVPPDGTGNINLVSTTSISSVGTIASNQIALSGSSSYLVDANDPGAPYQTIAAAITAAVSGGAASATPLNVVVKPGVYSGNFTLPDGVNIISWDRYSLEINQTGDPSINQGSVQITGQITVNGANCRLIGLWLDPGSTVAPIKTIGANRKVFLNKCKIFLYDEACFLIANGLTAYIDGCTIAAVSASTLDQFFRAAAGSVVFYINNSYVLADGADSLGSASIFMLGSDCQFSVNNTTSADFTISVTNSLWSTVRATELLDLPAGGICTLITRNSYLSAPTTAILHNSLASTYTFIMTRVAGAVSVNAASIVEKFPAQQSNATSQYQEISAYGSNDIFYRLNNRGTGAASSYYQALVQPTGSNPYWNVAVDSTRSYAGGIHTSDSQIYKFTTQAGSDADPTVTEVYRVKGSTLETTFQGAVTVNGAFSASAGFILKTTVPGAYPYSVLLTDDVVLVDTTSSRTITLPAVASAAIGQVFTIKDNTGTANSNNITIQVTGGSNIDGSATYTINNNYDSIQVINTGTKYAVI